MLLSRLLLLEKANSQRSGIALSAIIRIHIPDYYNDRRITNIGTATDSNDAVKAVSIQRSYLTYATTTGTNNAYSIILPINSGSYAPGMMVSFKANTANTGSVTLNVNGCGARNIFQNVNTPLASGDILADQIVTVIYDVPISRS